MNSPGANIRREPLSLKDAATQLVTACGGQERAAAMTRVSSSQIHRYTAPDQHDYQMPIDVVLALEIASGNPLVSRFMAQETGHILISTSPADNSPLAQDIATVGEGLAKFFAEWAAAMADGDVTPKEAARIEKRAVEGLNALAAVIAETRRIRKGGAA